MNFHDDIPSFPIGDFNDHFVLVVDLTPKQDATGNCFYPDVVGEQLVRAKLRFPSRTRFLTQCVGRTTFFGCSLQFFCCWKYKPKSTALLAKNY